jgi:hypothetical protein
VRVTNGAEKAEWQPADFASAFLDWLVASYPVCVGATISTHDIGESFFPEFTAATGRSHLRLGTLLRGLGEVTQRAEYKYTDRTGRRRNGVEYVVPKRGRA